MLVESIKNYIVGVSDTKTLGKTEKMNTVI